MPNILSLVEEVGLGGIDGALRRQDSLAGRTEQLKQWSTWAEVVYALGGLGLGVMRFSPTYTDPLIYGGIFGLSQRLGEMVMKQVKPTVAAGMMEPFRLAQLLDGGDGAGFSEYATLPAHRGTRRSGTHFGQVVSLTETPSMMS